MRGTDESQTSRAGRNIKGFHINADINNGVQEYRFAENINIWVYLRMKLRQRKPMIQRPENFTAGSPLQISIRKHEITICDFMLYY